MMIQLICETGFSPLRESFSEQNNKQEEKQNKSKTRQRGPQNHQSLHLFIGQYVSRPAHSAIDYCSVILLKSSFFVELNSQL